MSIQFPEDIKKKLTKIAEDSKIDLETILKEYVDTFQSNDIQDNPNFEDDEERHGYVVSIMNTKYRRRPPLTTTSFIPLGIDGPRKTRKNEDMLTLIALVDFKNLEEFLILGEQVKSLNGITRGLEYQVGVWKTKEGDFRLDDRSKFHDPVPPQKRIIELLRDVKIPKVSVAQAPDFPSDTTEVKNSDGSLNIYPVKTDWRRIRAKVEMKRSGIGDSGSHWYMVIVDDDSIPEEDLLDEDGNLSYSGLQCFTDKETYEAVGRYDLCDWYVTLSNGEDKEGNPNTTAQIYYHDPIHKYTE